MKLRKQFHLQYHTHTHKILRKKLTREQQNSNSENYKTLKKLKKI